MDKKHSWQDDKSWDEVDLDVDKRHEDEDRDLNNKRKPILILWNSEGTGIFNKIFNWFKPKN